MKFLPILLLYVTAVHAEYISTRIHSIDRSTGDHQPHLVKFENGRVGFLSSSDKSYLSILVIAKKRGEWLHAELDSHGNFLGASVIAEPKELTSQEPNPDPIPSSYIPSDLSSASEAGAIFSFMRRAQTQSQCYNRAHIWTYEEFKRSGLRSMKLFMFFTRAYIYRYRYQWWFHVTPMTYVNGMPITMDRTFMRRPVDIKTWTDNFIYSKKDCPIITKYSSYRDHQDTEHCYLHPASMYFWQPRDLENFEQSGFQKNQFINSEINWAYWDAF